MYYKPEKSVAAFMWCLWPMLVAVIGTPFIYGKHPTITIIMDVVMVLLSSYLLLSTVLVMRTTIYVDDECIAVRSPLVSSRISWSEVTNAVLRERRNAVSRTDTWLTIKSPNNFLSCNPSALSLADEKAVLAKVRSKTELVVKQGPASI